MTAEFREGLGGLEESRAVFGSKSYPGNGRALVKGMAFHKGIALNAREERQDADESRMAVKEVVCDSNEERRQYEEVPIAITVDEPLKRYYRRIEHPDFWSGESDLLHASGVWGSGFILITECGLEFCKGSRNKKKKNAVWLLYSGRNHYDLLVQHREMSSNTGKHNR